MTDNPLPKLDDERYDYEHSRRWPGIFRRRAPTPKKSGHGLAIAVAIGSLFLQTGSVIWNRGGDEQRTAQRLTNLENKDKEHDKRLDETAADIKQLGRDGAQQASTLAAVNATYAEILRRLEAGDKRDERIEAKIDQLRRDRR